MKDKVFKNIKFMNADDDEFEDEVKELVNWSEQLDFDKYVSNWYIQSTSNFDENNYND